jgi:anti-anti-sigma factor
VPLLTVALVPAPDQVVVRLTGNADLSTVPLIADALARAAGLGTPHLLVDVSAVRIWDSSALRTLAEAAAELRRADRSCRIVGAGPATRRLVRAADLLDDLELDGPVPPRPPVPRPAPAPRAVAPSPRGAPVPPARTPAGATAPNGRA